MPKNVPIYDIGCPVTNTMQLLSKRWVFFIIRAIRNDVKTFNAIKRALGGRISSRTLADRLHELTTTGLIQKHTISEKTGKEEYIFTQKGSSIQPMIDNMCSWAAGWESKV